MVCNLLPYQWNNFFPKQEWATHSCSSIYYVCKPEVKINAEYVIAKNTSETGNWTLAIDIRTRLLTQKSYWLNVNRARQETNHAWHWSGFLLIMSSQIRYGVWRTTCCHASSSYTILKILGRSDFSVHYAGINLFNRAPSYIASINCRLHQECERNSVLTIW